jgi:Spy/CpxP family protein refolding chaperone
VKQNLKSLSYRTSLVAGALLLLGLAASVQAGIPRTSGKNQNSDQGPYGLPGIKKMTEALTLTHDQEQALLGIYNSYKHQEHQEMQAKDKASSSSGKSDCVNSVKKILTPDQQKKFDDLLSESGKKKKT